jgi:hypothetical protein
MGKVAWLTGLIRRASNILSDSRCGPGSTPNDSRLPVDNLPVAAVEVATENEEL